MLFAELSDAVVNAIVAGIVTVAVSSLATLGGIVKLWLQIREDRKEAKKTAAAIAGDVLRLEQNTNSIKDELVALTRKEAHARGVQDEKEDQAARDKTPPEATDG